VVGQCGAVGNGFVLARGVDLAQMHLGHAIAEVAQNQVGLGHGGIDLSNSGAWPPMGSRRTRRRALSNITTLPAAGPQRAHRDLRAGSRPARSGRRWLPWRKRITDGRASRRSAKKVPKSVSAETTTLSSAMARAMMSSSEAVAMRSRAHGRASCPLRRSPSATSGDKALSTRNLMLVVRPGTRRHQATVLSGSSRSRTASAA